MYRAVEQGIVQQMIGDSALAFQKQVDAGKQTIVGVNAYQVEENPASYPSLDYPDPARMRGYIERLRTYKLNRSSAQVDRALADLARAANDRSSNVFCQVVQAADAGATHGEICGTLRQELGFGQPLTMV